MLRHTDLPPYRLNLASAIKQRDQNLKLAAQGRYHRAKELEDDSIWKKNLWMHEEYIRKEIGAQALKTAIKSSVELARSHIRAEQQMKASKATRVVKIAEKSSTMVRRTSSLTVMAPLYSLYFCISSSHCLQIDR